jgi:hypothetical protein
MSSQLGGLGLREEKLYDGDSCIYGSTYLKEKGHKVLVVVDDSMDVLHKGKAINSHQIGLLEIRDHCAQIDEIRAVGFFMLPKPQDEEDLTFIAQRVQAWISDFNDCDIYMWVDYFYGEGLDPLKISGSDFVKYWKSCYPELIKKIAFISTGGKPAVQEQDVDAPDDTLEQPRASAGQQAEVFRKYEFEDHGFLPKHREWLDLNEHPLEKLWRLSRDWFINDEDINDTGDAFYMKHNPGSICQYFLGDTRNRKRQIGYRRCLVDAADLKFPDSWWRNENTITAIHESLKHLCGVHFCGQVDAKGLSDFSRRHISTGSALLLAMMAHQHIHNDLGIFSKADIWDNAVKVYSPVFPLQSKEVACKSAILLFECFKKLFEQKHLDGKAVSPVRALYFENEGKKLVIQLSWNAQQRLPRDEQTLAEALHRLVLDDSRALPVISDISDTERQSKTRFAVLDVLRYLTISDSGFGAPGTFYMDGNKLIVASTV